ncbi:DUF6907 domain-containing protein [Streptomyces sp. NPDC001665]
MSRVAPDPVPVPSPLIAPVLPAPASLQSPPQAFPTASHPTACPPWCKDRQHPMGHHYGASTTAHWSPQVQLLNPRPLESVTPVVVRAELYRGNEGTALGMPVLYVQGETDIDLSRFEADLFIARAQAFVDTLRVLRRQMT